jgi:thioredoxin 1
MKSLLFSFIIIALAITSCKKESTPDNILLDIQDLTILQNKANEGVTLVFFHATWCSLCARQRKEIQPIVTDIALSQVHFLEVNFEKQPEIIAHYNVQGFPTILLLKEGKVEQTLVGANNKSTDLKQKLLQLLN